MNALAIHDDGSGPALYVAGGFWAAGRVHATNIVKWDGATWSPLGTGVNGIVHALTVFDDGTGPALYAGGLFTVAGGASANRVARWDGAAWSALGTGVAGREAIVRALTVFDDGTGAALYAAGSFATAGGVSANKIAKWDGSSWSALGVGFDGMDPGVYAMAVHDDGSGSALFVGGNFDLAGGASANHVAKWDGSTWSDVGGGMTGNADMTVVNALTVFDDGSGAALHAGGLFTDAGGIRVDNIAKWNGTSWSALASGLSGNGVHLQALTVFDDGAGSALYAAGFPGPGFGWAGIAKWNGSTWSEIDGPFGVLAFIAFDAGSGLALYAGGSFAPSAGTIPYSIARWDGTNWSALVDDWNGILGTGVPEVNSFAVFDDGSGSALYAAGSFQHAGSLATSNIARWNGSSWSQLDGGYGGSSGRMFAAAVFDDGSGPALFVGGSFDHPGGSTLNVTRWNGSTWSPPGGAPGTGTDGTVLALTVFDDGSGPALYAAGQFSAAGGAAASRIAKWNGSSWAALGVGVNDDVHALEVFDDGSGLALYAGGAFTTAGGAAASRIAKWNGSSWSALGTGVNGFVRALKAFDDGSGPALCVGGSFTTAGGAAASRIARWNGSGWATLGVPPFDGPNGSVYTLAELNDGSGAALYVGGGFQAAGGLLVANITKWDGSSWSALATNGTAGTALAGSDGGITWGGARVIALVVFDDGADGAPELYAGGRFEYAGAQSAMHIAKWHRCPPGTAYCFGDGLDPVVTALCPCSNFGEPGHGCANSNPSLGGARLWATGTTSPNTLLFICEGIPNNALATFWRGTANTPGGGVVHDGIQCLGGTTIRFGQQNAGQLGNPPFTISAGTVALAPGSTRYYQVLYRNPAPAFCPPGTYNFSNGYIVTW